MRRNNGFALVAALSAMVILMLLAVAMSVSAMSTLRSGGDLLRKAKARELAEAGIEHAIVRLESEGDLPSWFEGLLGEGTYRVEVERSGSPDTWQVKSTGIYGSAKHTAVAILRLSEREGDTQPDPRFSKGWLTGGQLNVNGSFELYGTHLHADPGFILNGRLERCSEEEGCERLLPSDVSAADGIQTYCVANSRSAKAVCEDNMPVTRVCPIYQIPEDPELVCTDLITGKRVRWDQATRIGPPLVDELSQNTMGTSVETPYYDARDTGRCDFSFSRLNPGFRDELRAALDRLSVPYGRYEITADLVDKFIRAVNGTGKRICVGGPVVFNQSGLNLKDLDFYVQGSFTLNGSGHLEGVRVASSGAIILNGRATLEDSRLYTASRLTFNGAIEVIGDATLASKEPLIFNGRTRLKDGRGPLIASEGYIIMNGSISTPVPAIVWSGDRVTLNGRVRMVGGIVSLNGITANGGGVYKSQAFANDDIPEVPLPDTGGVVVRSRR